MGNDTTKASPGEEATDYSLGALTLGGKMKLNWDERVEMSTNAHHVLFSEFLEAGGAFERFVEECPLVYTSNNAPEKRDVLGTAVLGIIDGAKRFRHFDSLTGDGVSAETFGMAKAMSCDSVRRGLLKIDAKAGLAWAFRQFGFEKCEFPPWIGDQFMLNL